MPLPCIHVGLFPLTCVSSLLMTQPCLLRAAALLHTAHFHIPDVAYIPKLSMNLISVSQLASRGYLVIFDELLCYVQDRHTGTLIGTGRHLSRVYVLDHLRLSLPASCAASQFAFPRLASRSGITVLVIPVELGSPILSVRAS